MDETAIRKAAASLAWECRQIHRKGDWTIREWNASIRRTVRSSMNNIRNFHRRNP